MRFLTAVLLVTGLLWTGSPVVAQGIDCSAGCTDTKYGLGTDVSQSRYVSRDSTFSGACGTESEQVAKGQVVIREQNTCSVSLGPCPVEIPVGAQQSGPLLDTRQVINLGSPGFLYAAGNLLRDLGGSIGERRLRGFCALDANEPCASDSDCPSAAGCFSQCAVNAGLDCKSDSDCPGSDTCVTEIEWGTLKSANDGCVCCDSDTAGICALVGLAEYPALTCPLIQTTDDRLETPAWVFDGGPGTPFVMDSKVQLGQAEGVCSQNRSRSCGVAGDLLAGALNDKCVGLPPCSITDPLNPPLASSCDDLAFGGIVGDVCDLSESGFRTADRSLFPDGSPDPSVCAFGTINLAGTPGTGCKIPTPMSGDPQPLCLLQNYGVGGVGDLDCDGIAGDAPFGDSVILAAHDVAIGNYTKIESGDVTANEAGGSVSLAVGVQTAVGASVKADAVGIAAGSAVNGNVYYNTLSNSGSILGATLSPLDLPVVADVPSFSAGFSGRSDVVVASGTTRSLRAGLYRDLKVGRGATLIFRGKKYQVRNIQVAEGGRLEFEAPSRVSATGYLHAARESRIGERAMTFTLKPIRRGSASASEIVFSIGGADSRKLASLGLSAVTVGDDSRVYANIYAGQGSIRLGNRMDVKGAFVGENFSVGTKSRVRFDPALTK